MLNRILGYLYVIVDITVSLDFVLQIFSKEREKRYEYNDE